MVNAMPATRKGVLWSALCVFWACSGTLVPAPSATRATPPAAPSFKLVAAPSEAPAPKIWTTAPDTDVCTEYEKPKAPDFSLFDTLAACEQWVHERRCRPGMACNDGCNDIACDGTGMRLRSTLLGCGLSIGIGALEFAAKSRRLTTSPDWEGAVRRLQQALRVPERKLKIIGFALPDEAAVPAAARRLARQRAESVARELAARGVDRGRFVIEVGEPSWLGVEGYRVGRVLVQLDPERRQPQEFDPSSSNYEDLCWVKYPR
jgi:hypothetical protein